MLPFFLLNVGQLENSLYCVVLHYSANSGDLRHKKAKKKELFDTKHCSIFACVTSAVTPIWGSVKIRMNDPSGKKKICQEKKKLYPFLGAHNFFGSFFS